MAKRRVTARTDGSERVPIVRWPFPGIDAWVIRGRHTINRGPAGSGDGDMHYNVEMGIVVSGIHEERYADQCLRLKPGEAWLVGVWETHRGISHQPPTETVVLGIWPDVLTRFRMPGMDPVDWLSPFVAPVAIRPRVPPESRDEMLVLARRLAAVIDGPDDASRQPRLLLLTLEVLLLLCQDWSSPRDSSPTRESWDLVTRTMRVVSESKVPLSVPQVAAAVGMSRSRFDRGFRRAMGMPFGQFALRNRLSQAAGQLRSSGERIKEIAVANGFVDASHFNHLFQAHYGCTPGAYRAPRRQHDSVSHPGASRRS